MEATILNPAYVEYLALLKHLHTLDPNDGADRTDLMDKMEGLEKRMSIDERLSAEMVAFHLVEQGKSRWIPVAERLPEHQQEVLAWLKPHPGEAHPSAIVVDFDSRPVEPGPHGSIDRSGHWTELVDGEWFIVTHWMQLPELPNGDD